MKAEPHPSVAVDAVQRALGALPQAARLEAAAVARAAQVLARWAMPERQRALSDLAGWRADELAVLVAEARGVRDPLASARSLVQDKLLVRTPESGPDRYLDVVAPFAGVALEQGRGRVSALLAHEAAQARLASGKHPELRPDPSLVYLELPTGEVGIARLRICRDADDLGASPRMADAVALGLGQALGQVDGALGSRPARLMVVDVWMPGLETWGPVLRAAPGMAQLLREAARGVALAPSPVQLAVVSVDFDPGLVRDALRVGAGVWERCVLGGAVPSHVSEQAPQSRPRTADSERMDALAVYADALRKLSDLLTVRQAQAQDALLAAVDGTSQRASVVAGDLLLSAGRTLDVPRAARELERRGFSAAEWSEVDWDVDGMRAALEGLGVDASAFARPGRPLVARMEEALGTDAEAFQRVVWRVEPRLGEGFAARPAVEDFVTELAGNACAVIEEALPSWGVDLAPARAEECAHAVA